MKKVISILVALLTFAIGTYVFYLRPFIVPVRPFELRGNLERYKYQKIKVTGYFEATTENSKFFYSLYDYKKPCSENEECWTSISLELTKEIEEEEKLLIKELTEKLTEAQKLAKEGKLLPEIGNYVAEVELAGYVEERKSVLFNDYYPMLKVVEFKQTAPIRVVSQEEILGAKYKERLGLK